MGRQVNMEIKVRGRGGERDLQKALKIFKRKINDDGLLKEYRDRMYFEKQSSKKRRKHARAVNAQKRQTREDNEGWDVK